MHEYNKHKTSHGRKEFAARDAYPDFNSNSLFFKLGDRYIITILFSMIKYFV